MRADRRLRAAAGVVMLVVLSACQTTSGGAGPQTAGLRRTVDPDSLIGLDAAGLQAAMGEPTRIRKEATAEIWQYQGGACVFDVFIYPEGNSTKVVLYEARDQAGKKTNANPCVKDVLQAQATVSS